MEYIWTIKLFAGLQDRFGTNEITFPSAIGQMAAGEFKHLLAKRYPQHGDLLAGSFIARNLAYAAEEEQLSSEDELALLPPVSGGEDAASDKPDVPVIDRYTVTNEPLDSAQILAKVITPDHGASLAFVGTTREWTNGQRTVRLEYEAYEPMAVASMKQIGDEIGERWPGALCAISHRIGVVQIAEASVVIAVSAPHREHCYDASRYAIERLKQIVPIWKKEIWEDGSEWKGQQTGPWNPIASVDGASKGERL